MSKLAFFLIIAVLIYWIIKARLSEDTENKEENTEVDETGSGTPKSLEEMVRCAHCGVHLPRSESITSQSKFFCCDEHRRKHLDSST